MVYIVGLGNPGIKYEKTRHNVGFTIAERVASALGISLQEKSKLSAEVGRGSAGGKQVTIVKPLTFMNLSGQPVRAVIDFFQDFSIEGKEQNLEALYVVFDDLDLEVGSTKLQFGKGPHGHNGLNSLYEHLGTTQFWHVRVGVDGRQGNRSVPPDRYVLQQFEKKEIDVIKSTVEEVAQQLVELVHA